MLTSRSLVLMLIVSSACAGRDAVPLIDRIRGESDPVDPKETASPWASDPEAPGSGDVDGETDPPIVVESDTILDSDHDEVDLEYSDEVPPVGTTGAETGDTAGHTNDSVAWADDAVTDTDPSVGDTDAGVGDTDSTVADTDDAVVDTAVAQPDEVGVAVDEVCGDGVDNDGDGLVDEGGVGAVELFADGDGDGHGAGPSTGPGCEGASGMSTLADDCDDGRAEVSPEARELCNGRDDDCSGEADDGLIFSLWFTDVDGDGFGDPATQISACEQPPGSAAIGGDCDDLSADVHLGGLEVCDGRDQDCDGQVDEDLSLGTWFLDMDGDGHGGADTATSACSQPGGTVVAGDDCDDTLADVFPLAPEICDGRDQDCDLLVDEGLPQGTWYVDVDMDGHGDPASGAGSCLQPLGTVSTGDDCDDTTADIHPAAPETCDQRDEDCDGAPDDGLPVTPWYRDGDGDGFGETAEVIERCSSPDGYVITPGDCEDGDPTVRPGAVETCDHTDEDCDGGVDENFPGRAWYRDADRDGFGNALVSRVDCAQPPGFILDATDCDDARGDVWPGAPDVWYDGLDANCDGNDWDQDGDGLTRAGAPLGTANDCDDMAFTVRGPSVWYADDDGDGFGDARQTFLACSLRPGLSTSSADCDDHAVDVHPGAVETCDGRDENCNGTADEGVQVATFPDQDQDGFGAAAATAQMRACISLGGRVLDSSDCDDGDDVTFPGAAESCDALDNDCEAATPADPSGTCGSGTVHVEYGGHIYVSGGTGKTWSFARSWCESRGYYLWYPSSDAENSLVRVAAGLYGSDIWTGVNNLCADRSGLRFWGWYSAPGVCDEVPAYLISSKGLDTGHLAMQPLIPVPDMFVQTEEVSTTWTEQQSATAVRSFICEAVAP